MTRVGKIPTAIPLEDTQRSQGCDWKKLLLITTVVLGIIALGLGAAGICFLSSSGLVVSSAILTGVGGILLLTSLIEFALLTCKGESPPKRAAKKKKPKSKKVEKKEPKKESKKIEKEEVRDLVQMSPEELFDLPLSFIKKDWTALEKLGDSLVHVFQKIEGKRIRLRAAEVIQAIPIKRVNTFAPFFKGKADR